MEAAYFYYYSNTPNQRPVRLASIRIVLGDGDLAHSGKGALGELVGTMQRRLSDQTAKRAAAPALSVSAGRYRRGSHIFDAIEIFAAAESLRRFLMSYRSMRKGVIQIIADIEFVVRNTARWFADIEGKPLLSVRIDRLRTGKILNLIKPKRRRRSRRKPGGTNTKA